MRYYTTEYRNELNSALTNMVSALDDSYTSAINAVEECGTENIDCYKYDALDVANRACASVEALTEQINSVSTQLMAFYDHVDEIADMMKSDAETIIEILDMTNNAISNLCDLLNGVGSFENQPVTSYNIGVACEPMSGVEEKRKQFLNDYYLDENGLVDQAAVSRTCDTINESYDAEAEDGEQFSSIGNTTADMYAEFIVDYTSREDFNDEMMNSLLNANMAAGMIQDTDSPAPEATTTEIDGTDYYIVNFPYESTPALDTINDRVYQLNLERYRQNCDEEGNCDSAYNTSSYLDTMNALTIDHISAPQLIPCSEVNLDEINGEIPLASSLVAPDFPSIINYSSQTDADGNRYATVSFDLPIDDPYCQVVLFSTDEIYISNSYDANIAPRTGAYPTIAPYTFYFPCDSLEIRSVKYVSNSLSDEDLEAYADAIEGELIPTILGYILEAGSIVEGIVALATGAFIFELAEIFAIPIAIIAFVYNVTIKIAYEHNVDMDYDYYSEVRAAIGEQDMIGGSVVLHNEDSGFEDYELGEFYFDTYSRHEN